MGLLDILASLVFHRGRPPSINDRLITSPILQLNEIQRDYEKKKKKTIKYRSFFFTYSNIMLFIMQIIMLFI